MCRPKPGHLYPGRILRTPKGSSPVPIGCKSFTSLRTSSDKRFCRDSWVLEQWEPRQGPPDRLRTRALPWSLWSLSDEVAKGQLNSSVPPLSSFGQLFPSGPDAGLTALRLRAVRQCPPRLSLHKQNPKGCSACPCPTSPYNLTQLPAHPERVWRASFTLLRTRGCLEQPGGPWCPENWQK